VLIPDSLHKVFWALTAPRCNQQELDMSKGMNGMPGIYTKELYSPQSPTVDIVHLIKKNVTRQT
jgi:hypothetical protein